MTWIRTRRLDRRNAVAVAVRKWKEDVHQDPAATSAGSRSVELAARTWLIVSSLDDWLARQPSLVNARRRSVLPAVLQRQQLAGSLARPLERLGLERRANPLPTPLKYSREFDRRKAESAAV